MNAVLMRREVSVHQKMSAYDRAVENKDNRLTRQQPEQPSENDVIAASLENGGRKRSLDDILRAN